MSTDAPWENCLQHGSVTHHQWCPRCRLEAAAPEMLEALKWAAEWFQQYADGHTAKGDTAKAARNQSRADACRAAIAKATQSDT